MGHKPLHFPASSRCSLTLGVAIHDMVMRYGYKTRFGLRQEKIESKQMRLSPTFSFGGRVGRLLLHFCVLE